MKNALILILISILAGVGVYFAMTSSDSASEYNPHTNPVNDPLSSAPPADLETLISPAADGAAVFIMEPGDGTTVSSPVTVKFGITNMQVAPAGQNTEYSGHHHLLINVDELPAMDAPLPSTDQIIHFGGGQTETTIELEPGVHTLQLLLGNHLHIPHDKPVISKKITITVK